MMNLVRDYSLASNPDSEGYLHLNLRHNRMNDPDLDHFLWGVASFRLGDIRTEFPDLKGLKIEVRTMSDTRDYTCDFAESETDGRGVASETNERSIASYVK